MPTSTIRLHRVVRAPPERVYRAFIDGDALCRWLPPHGFVAHLFSMDAVVGGGYRMRFTDFASGEGHSFTAVYRELQPHRRIVHADRFDDPALAGEILVTIDFTEVSIGTDLAITQAGIPELIPPEMCHRGWQDSLSQLALLVETQNQS